MRNIFTLLFSISLYTSMAQTAVPFTPGNVVVYRVGEKTRALRAYSAPVFLDEYTPTGSLVQSVAIPRKTATSIGLVAQGSSANEGMMTRSADGKYLVFGGYNADTGVQAVNGSTAIAVARVAGRADAAANISITKFDTNTYSGISIRGVASPDGALLYMAAANGGIRKGTFGDSSTIRVSATGANAGGTATYPANFRSVNIYNGQLYGTTAAGTAYRLVQIGTGLPTDTGAVVTNLTGIPSTSAPNQFFFVDTDTVPGADVVYIADNGNTVSGIQKYSLVTGKWVSNSRAVPSVGGPTGLTGVVNGKNVKLFFTSGINTTVLYTLTDTTGYNKTIVKNITLLATAAGNTAFRSVAMAPGIVIASAPNDYFRSKATGNWNSTNTWESSADSILWHAATLTPAENAKAITIRSPHTITVTANVTAPKTTVNTGAAVLVNTGVTLIAR